MSVPYTSYQALVIGNAIAMLEASPTFVALATGVSLTAPDIIIESMGGLNPAPGQTITKATAISGHQISVPAPGTAPTTPFAVVQEAAFQTELIAMNTNGFRGEISVQIYTLQVSTDAPAEILRRARNIAGGIQADLDSLWGTSTSYLMRGHTSLEGCVYLDKTTDLGGYCLSTLSMHWMSP